MTKLKSLYDIIIKSTFATQGFTAALLDANKSGIIGFLTTIPKLIAGLKAYGVANTIATIKTIGLSATLKELNISPTMLALNAIVLAFVGLTAVIDACTTTTEEYSEKLSQSSQDLKDINSKITDLNSELETTRQRITELEAKDSLTLVEQNELAKLKETNSQLEKQISLQERQQKIKSAEVSSDFANAVKSWQNDTFQTDNDKKNGFLQLARGIDIFNIDFDYTSNVNTIRKLLTTYQKLKSMYDKSLSDGDLELSEKLKSYMESQENVLSQQLATLQEYKSQVSGIDYQYLSKDAKSVYDYIEDVENQILLITGDTESVQQVFDGIYNSEKFKNARNALSELGDEGKLTADKLKELYTSNKSVKELLDYLNQLGLIDLSDMQGTDESSFLGVFGNNIKQLSGSVNTSNASLEQFINQLNKAENSADQATQSIKTLSEVSEELDKLQENYKSLSDIVQDYNENGFLSIDNLQTLSEMDAEYIATLQIENGQLSLNTEAYKKLLNAKLNDLEINQVKSVLNNVLNMSKEEAQAYANAQAYTEESNSILSLVQSEIQLAQIKAKTLDYENKTDVYSKAVQTATSQAVNIMTFYEQTRQAMNDNMDAVMGATVASENQTKALEEQKDALEKQKNALEDAKKAQEDYKDGLEDSKSAIENLIDLTKDYIKQTKEDEKSALEDSKNAVLDRVDAELKLLEAEKDRHDFEKSLSEKQNDLSSANLALIAANLDDSAVGKKNQKEAQDNYNSAKSDMNEYLYEHNYDIQKEALEAYRDSQEEYYDGLIQTIDDYLNDEVQLYKDACSMIDNDNGTLYSNLFEYIQTYTTKSQAEFNHLWTEAQSALSEYNNLHYSTFDLLNYLQSEIYNTETVIQGYESQIEDVGNAIDVVSSKIDDVSNSVNNNATALNNWSDAYEKIKNSLRGWQADYIIDGKRLTFTSDLSDKKAAAQDIASKISAQLQGKIDMPWYGIYGSLRQYYKGTKSAEGGLSLVGERGAELRVLNQGDSIITNEITNRLMDFASNPMKFLSDVIHPVDFANLSSVDYGTMFDSLSNNVLQNNDYKPTVNINIQGDATQSTVNALKKESNNIINQATKQFMRQTLNIVGKNKNLSKFL